MYNKRLKCIMQCYALSCKNDIKHKRYSNDKSTSHSKETIHFELAHRLKTQQRV